MAEIKHPNTKKNSLINAGTIRSSKELQSYLGALYPSLTIKQWISDETRNDRSKLARNILKKVCRELGDLVNKSQTNNVNSCAPYVGSVSVAMANNSMSRSYNNYNPSMNRVNNASLSLNSLSYNGTHSVTYPWTGLCLYFVYLNLMSNL